ncbi:Helix-turn-helix [Oceanobacillus limi]|uniref:Helix-turn-helix n=1 Tax=Oceanobacillus limi TaxID=930131 RepID=A0A1I0FK16_9BACI|nr:helix-turn-helix transcriptional regulator [Oceanobacillus limi]SET57792.1 Helix-turn-helix [Oceanobacillus limi]
MDVVKDFGEKIKFHRLKANMTQEDLSKGIISVSYLSKIEAGILNPTNEIRESLCQKLNLDPLFLENNKMQELCQTWFKHLLHRNLAGSIELYEKINNNIDYISNKQLLHLFQIHKLSFFLFTKNKTEAANQFEYLQNQSPDFKGSASLYWHKASGDYHFSQLAYTEALNCYQEAEKKISNEQIHLPEEEKMDLYYLIAITASKVRNTYIAIVYSSEALEYYRSVYNLVRCARCHILLGLSYQRANDYQKAIENYELAITIVKSINDKKALALCYQNMGKLNSMMKQTEIAIDYFQKSYQLRGNEPASKRITPISSLMKEYYNLGDIHQADHWLEKGLKASETLSPTDSIYVHEFKVFEQLIRGFDKSFPNLINEVVIPFLNEKQLVFEKSLYLKILGDYYFNNRKYKLAALTYHEANSILGTFNSD